MNFTKFSPIKKKLQQERAEVKAIIRGLERIRRYIVANRGEAEVFVRQFLNLNEKEASLSVAQMVKSFRDRCLKANRNAQKHTSIMQKI